MFEFNSSYWTIYCNLRTQTHIQYVLMFLFSVLFIKPKTSILHIVGCARECSRARYRTRVCALLFLCCFARARRCSRAHACVCVKCAINTYNELNFGNGNLLYESSRWKPGDGLPQVSHTAVRDMSFKFGPVIFACDNSKKRPGILT